MFSQIVEREGRRLKGAEIVKILKEQFGADYTLSGVYDLPARLNIVWITVRSKHPKADLEKQKDFQHRFSQKVFSSKYPPNHAVQIISTDLSESHGT